MAYLMVIDAGTGSVRSVIFDENGKQIGVSSREWQHKEDPRYQGSMDFDCENNWLLCLDTIKEVFAKTKIMPTEIKAIATTSMREAIVLYDENNKEIWACANVDARGSTEVAQLKSISEHIERDIYKISGQTFSLGALCRLLWVKNNMPDIYEKTKSISMLDNWLTFKLSGILSVEPSNGCTTGIFDLLKRTFDTEIAALCGLRSDIFPKVYECGEVLGKISGECASESGLSTETLVVVGGGDAQLGALGAGVVNSGQAAVFGGSFWQLEYNTDKLNFDENCRIRINCHAVPNMWQYEAIAFFPGLIMRWYRDAFCQLEQQIENETGKSAYAQMDAHAEKVPAGSNSMLCTFSNVMDYIAWRHAAPTFTNFSINFTKHNRYTFYRAIMENAAFVTRGHLLLAENITGDKISEIVFAGGASQSPLWCQILADVLNVKIKVPVVKESTALGAAICAGVGAKMFSDLKDGCEKVVCFERSFEPIQENRAVYDAMYQKFLNVYEAQLKLADQKVTDYMWVAPGL